MENSNYKNKITEKEYWNTLYDLFINYIFDPIGKTVSCFKDKVVSVFNTNTPKRMVHRRGKKLSKPKTQKQSKGININSIRNIFLLKKRTNRIE